MKAVFEPQPQTLAPTSDGSVYPVSRVFCIGANYAAHTREMGGNPDRDPPFFFTKWPNTVVGDGTEIAYPPQTENFHFEGELVVAIGKTGHNIPEAEAFDYIYGYATGLDMTRRDLQQAARTGGRPWDVGKNIEQSSPLGVIHPASETGPLTSGRIRLTQNGEVKQDSDLNTLIWSIPEIIAFVSRFYHLQPGDLIYTGTPAGVGPTKPGDELVVTIEGLTNLKIKVGAAV